LPAPAPAAGKPAPNKPAAPPAASSAAPAPAHPAPPPAPAAKPAARAPGAKAGPAQPAKAQSQAGQGAETSSIAGAMVVAGVIAVVIGVFALRPRTPVQPPADHSPTMPAVLQPLKPAVEPQLTLMFRKDMWVSVTVDGVEKFQGRVPQGSKQEWKAKRLLSLRASDPQSLQLTLNGAPYTLPAPEADGTFKIEAN
jgi:hypothetical protein